MPNTDSVVCWKKLSFATPPKQHYATILESREYTALHIDQIIG